jgi:F-type H+-transporting ATPase subunit epsilon
MATFHFDLVSPEKLLFSGEVDQVDVPGSEGDFGVLEGHAPLMTTLRPGILTLHREAGVLKVVINGGFAEVSAVGLTVLADVAVPIEDFDAASLTGLIEADTAELAKTADGPGRDKLAHRIDQLKMLQASLSAAKPVH